MEQAEEARKRILDRAEEEAFALKIEAQEQAEEIYAVVRDIKGLKRQHKELCVRATRWRDMELQTAQELGRIALEEQSRVESLSWDGVDVPQAVRLPELDGQEQESGVSLSVYLPGQRVGDDPALLESDPLDPGP